MSFFFCNFVAGNNTPTKIYAYERPETHPFPVSGNLPLFGRGDADTNAESQVTGALPV